MKSIKSALLFLSISLLFSSCIFRADADGDRYTGVLANNEIVSSIRQEIADKENSLLANDGDVFWTESGKLWHKTYECSYLANSKIILHGTPEEARYAGKEKQCERCFANAYDSIYDSLENKEYKTGDVFFTKEDTVWHRNINCVAIKGTQKIYFADKETAILLGKAGACSDCEK